MASRYRVLACLLLTLALAGAGCRGQPIPMPTPLPRPQPTLAANAISPANAGQVKELANLYRGSARDLAYAARANVLAIASDWGGIYLYDATSLAELGHLDIHSRCMLAIAPDGATLASCEGQAVYLWQAGDGTLLQTLPHTGELRSLAFSPDGATLASGAKDQKVRLWRVADGALLRTIEVDTPYVGSLAFSPDGSIIAADIDARVSLWRVADGTLLRTLIPEVRGWIAGLAFSPDGSLLAMRGHDAVHLWRVADGTLVRTMEVPRGQAEDDDGWGVAFSPDGATLAAGSSEGRLYLWQVSDGSLLRTIDAHPGAVTGLAFSPDGATLASIAPGAIDQVCLWRVADGTRLRTLGSFNTGILSLAFSPDSQTLALGTRDGVCLWQTAERRFLPGLPMGGRVWSLAFSPDGAILAAGAEYGAVRLWRTSDWAPLTTLTGHKELVLGLAFTADGASLTSASGDGTVRLWRVSDGELLRTLALRRGYGPRDYRGRTLVAFSPDGLTLAWAAENRVEIYHLSDGRRLRAWSPRKRVYGLGFAPDGVTLMTGDGDMVTRLRRVTDGSVVREYGGVGAEGVAFSPDGAVVAMATPGTPGRFVLSRVQDGMRLTTLKDDTERVAFSPDGALIASTLRVWGVETE